MGVNKKTDGRYIVGMGAPNENEYRGSQGWRDIFIQLTENGATPDSEEKLAFLRDYAIYHNGEGNAIMPPSVSVWVSNNGVTSAVEADDISLDGDSYTICGIKWDGSSWDYSNAGQSSGGGGSSLPSYTSSDVGKVLTVVENTETADHEFPEQTLTLTALGNVYAAPISGLDGVILSAGDTISITIDGADYDGEFADNGGFAAASLGDYMVGEVSRMGGMDIVLVSQTEGTHTISGVITTAVVITTINEQLVQFTQGVGSITIGDLDATETIAMKPEDDLDSVITLKRKDGVLSLGYDAVFFDDGKSGVALGVAYDGHIGCGGIEKSALLGVDQLVIDDSFSESVWISGNGPKKTLHAEWSFSDPGQAGVTPNGTISIVGNANNPTGSSVTINGIFKKVRQTPADTQYEIGTHTFSLLPGMVPMSEYVYAIAVPTVGEGDTEHIDCYVAFDSVSLGGGSQVNVSSSNMTVTRMKNQSNSNANVWHCVTANGTVSGSLSCSIVYA